VVVAVAVVAEMVLLLASAQRVALALLSLRFHLLSQPLFLLE
jgi:hypothetical protein